ncbi:MAG: thymidylate synthase [archaeon]
MDAYLDILRNIKDKGTLKENRTGIDTIALAGAMFEHDMKEGFPLITTKSVPLRLVASEIEFFIKGMTDKKWLQDNNNHIWDGWCNPEIVPYGHDEETKKKMAKERDLGPVYGFQWRHFGAKYEGYDKDYTGIGVDQLENVVNTLKTNPDDRRMLVNAWNPVDKGKMALPPCHYGFQVTVIDKKLNLLWNQRSVDSVLGLPFNIAGYGLMLHLLAKESGFEEGKLIGFLGDVHIYVNHLKGLEEQLKREPYKLPTIETEDFKSIFDWEYKQTTVKDYKHHPHIKFEVAI